MNDELTRALAGEATQNLAPYLAGTPPMRRPDARGEPPPQLRPAVPAPEQGLTTDAPRGHGRHRQDSTPPLVLILAVESVVLVVLLAWLVWLLAVTR